VTRYLSLAEYFWLAEQVTGAKGGSSFSALGVPSPNPTPRSRRTGRYGQGVLPETDVARARRWVADRNDRMPEESQDQIRYELDVDPRSLTILECRPPWKPEYGPEWTRFPIARLRYTKARKEWSIYWRDRNLQFHVYDLFDPTPNIEAVLAEVDRDPTCIFWG